jgi:hypothetical protein
MKKIKDMTRSELLIRFDEQRKGSPFDFPENPDELEMMNAWFFDRLRVIVSVENHTKKFDGIQQIFDILGDAKEIENIKVDIIYLNGQWFIADAGGPNDILALPRLLKRFGKIYRFHAKDYATGENQDIKYLSDSLDTVQNFKLREGF